MVVKDTGGDFARPETGMQQAVCSHIYDIGFQHTSYKGVDKDVHQCIVLWELEETIKEGDYAGKRFVVSKFYTASLSEKANLRKDLVSWRGREFSKEELDGFELDNIRRANCYLNLVEKKKTDGSSTVVVGAIVPFKKKDGVEPMTPELPDDYMPDWIKKIIDRQVKQEPMAHQPDTSGIEENDEIPF